jgi:hypothetical protein
MEKTKQRNKKSTIKALRPKSTLTIKRKQAIEKAIAFWESHSIDLSGFKFDREEANAR